MFAALGNTAYRLFVLSQVVAQSGAWVQRIALAWLVLELTESPVALGTLTALQYLPILLFSLLAGTLADRFPKRKALIALQVVTLAQAVMLAILGATGVVQLWHVYVLALVHGTVSAMEQPVRQALPFEMVGRELLTNAIALSSAIHSSSRIFGPALGGLVVASFGSAGAFLLNALAAVGVMGLLGAIRATPGAEQVGAARGSVLQQLGEAIRYAATTPPIALAFSVLTVLAIFGFNYNTFLPLLARYQLALGVTGYGLLSAALGGGAVVGALGMARWGKPSHAGMIASGSAFSAALLAVALSYDVVPSVILLAGVGMAGVFFTTSANSILQLTVPEHMRGRIMGMYSLLLMGMTPPGAAFTGAIADGWGISIALQVEAVICLLGLAGGLVYLTRMGQRPGLIASDNS
jgi:MFS family permease